MSEFFNVYYILNGKSLVSENHYLAAALVWARTILEAGGEITGIINVKDDQ